MKNLVNVLSVIVLVLGFIGMGVWYYKCFRFWIKAPLNRKVIRMRYNFRSKTRNLSVLKDVDLWIFMNPITDKFLFLKKQIGIETINLKVVFKDGKKKNIIFGIGFEFDSTDGVVTDFKTIERYLRISLLHSFPVEIYEAEIREETIRNKINEEMRVYCASIPSEEFNGILIGEMVRRHSINGITIDLVGNLSSYDTTKLETM